MTVSYDLHVETFGGVRDLDRTVGVLALLDITPRALTAHGGADGLHIDMRIEVDPRTCELCVNRLRALASIARATLHRSMAPITSGGLH